MTIKRDKATGANPDLHRNWLLAKDWEESRRYKMSTQSEAEKLFAAINDNANGVLEWVKKFW